jgi:sugar/nucleoside kinase (ribokinase family)
MPPPVIRGVLCAGNMVHDTVVWPVEGLAWNTTTWVDCLEQHLGGNGASTSYTLGILGVPVRLLAATGRDAFGDLLLARLAGAGVDVSAVVRSEAPTPRTVALVNAQGDRFFLHRAGASREAFAEPIEFSPALVGSLSHFHLANPFALPHMRRQAGEVLRRARAAGLTTSVDTGWDQYGRWMEDLAPCLPFTDLLFPNEDEARCLTGLNDVAAAATCLRELGAGAVIVKRGAEGCDGFTSDGSVHVPAFHVRPKDTTGAGDCFVGGFLAALHRGRDWQEAGRFANAVGALSVQKLGATTNLRSFEETEKWGQSAFFHFSGQGGSHAVAAGGSEKMEKC